MGPGQLLDLVGGQEAILSDHREAFANAGVTQARAGVGVGELQVLHG